MPRKRKGAELSRRTIKCRRLRDRRSERTEAQIRQENTEARIRMAQLRQKESEHARAQSIEADINFRKKNGSACDENGAPNAPEKDVCDCLTDGCPGCHFPCPKCRSCKCGVDCRVNRKWSYEVIENETEIAVTKDMNLPNS